MRPESVAPETWARVGLAEKRAKASASDRQIHFAKEELQPQLNIMIPLARFPCGSTRPFVASACAQERFALDRPADLVLRECERNHKRVQSTMHPIENLSTSSA
jgi:hypothetical protein